MHVAQLLPTLYSLTAEHTNSSVVGYPFSKLVASNDGDLLADSHGILNRWKNYFCQLLNVHGVSDVRQTEIHTAEPLVPDPSSFEVEIVIGKLKRYTSLIKFQMN
jgi:hypothetical protein